MGAESADLLACVAAFARALEGAFDPQRFLHDFSARAQALVPHDGMLIAWLEDGGRTFSAFARSINGPDVALDFHNYTIAFDPSQRFPRETAAFGPVFDGHAQLIADGASLPASVDPAGWTAWAAATGFKARIGVPLYAGGRIVGAFFTASRTPGRFGDEHVGAARQIADLVGPLVENVVLLQSERRRRERLQTISTLPPILAASLKIGDVLERLGDAVRPALDFDLLGVSRLRASGTEFERIALLTGGRPAGPRAFAIDESSILPRMRQGQVVLIRDAQRELDGKRDVDRQVLEAGIRSILMAPLVFGEEVVGGMFFAKRRPSWYDASDEEIVRAIADALVLALQHQRLAEEQQRAAVAEAATQQLEKRVQSLRGALEERFGFDTIQGRSPAFMTALGQAKKVAPTDTTVLLTGASGTGKEVLARAIHQGSARADGPFVAINCAALPETLIESELFGHERGAFTGADRLKRGRFELAAGGTLLLDEVGELAPAVQAKLLRVLQERSYERVGGTQTLSADVRLIAATNRNLEDAVASGKFREDLFYRLAVFRVHLPSLRERVDDILVLADRFVRELGSRMGKADAGLSREARDLLLAYHWPGNIRELQNAIERAVILSDGGLITAAQLGVTPAAGRAAVPSAHAAPAPVASSTPTAPPASRAGSDEPEVPATGEGGALEALPAMEKRALVEALRRAKGNKSQAAAALGLSRTRFYTLMRRYGLS
jgi:transcriptional regulator with GAF, ATPase, and Fis domain